MAAYAALASLLNNIQQMMNHPMLSTSFDNDQIQSLEEKAALLLDFIETFNYVGVGQEVQDLETQITSAAHTAEDVIESHIVNQLLPLSAHDREAAFSFSLYLQKKRAIQERNKPGVGDVDQFHGESNQAIEEKNVPAVRDEDQFHGGSNQEIEEPARHVAGCGCWINFMQLIKKKRAIEEKSAPAVGDVDQFRGGSNQAIEEPTPHVAGDGCLDYLRQIIEDMNAIIEKANELKEKHRFREEHSTPPLSNTQTREETAMVGFHDELIQLLDELTGHRSNLHIISVVGMGGMGKTTLAQSIYANQLIIERFDIRAWSTVSQKYNAKQILQQLLSSLGKSSEKSVDELGGQLHKTLSGRRYLIILDDIWSVEAWNEVRCFFPDNGSGSRILLTTRLSDVANHCGSSCFRKNLLDENESWELLCKKAFLNEDCPSELRKLGGRL